MKKFSLFCIPGLLAICALVLPQAHASIFDNEVDAKEASTALLHCPKESAVLLQNGRYLDEVVGQLRQISRRGGISMKQYLFKTATSRGMLAPPVQGPALRVDLKVIQPSHGLADAPAQMQWECMLLTL